MAVSVSSDSVVEWVDITSPSEMFSDSAIPNGSVPLGVGWLVRASKYGGLWVGKCVPSSDGTGKFTTNTGVTWNHNEPMQVSCIRCYQHVAG